MAKWIWRFHNEENAMWVQVVKAIHGEDGSIYKKEGKLLKNSHWRSICKGSSLCSKKGVHILSTIKKVIGDGTSTSFWHDKWSVLNQPLHEVFPRLYALEVNKKCTVAERLVNENQVIKTLWSWRTRLSGRSMEELPYLEKIMVGTSLQNGEKDKWCWKMDAKGVFKVKGLYNALLKSKSRVVSNAQIHEWNSWVPSKINMCIWRAKMDKLPTLTNLKAKGICITNSECLLCNSQEDSVRHVFFDCPKTKIIWRKTFAWWGIQYPGIVNWCGLLNSKLTPKLRADEFKIFMGVCYVLMWALWRWRNDILYEPEEENGKKKLVDIFPEVQRLSLSWIRWRCKHPSWEWSKWISDPKLVIL